MISVLLKLNTQIGQVVNENNGMEKKDKNKMHRQVKPRFNYSKGEVPLELLVVY